MVAITTTYQGELHCDSVHAPSQSHLATDAPKDNQGKGEAFSPTDLVATALTTCILTVMGIAARTLSVNMEGATASVEKSMTPPPRRIASLPVTVTMPAGIPAEHRPQLEKAANSCPVKQSLHPDIAITIAFEWQ